MAEHAAPHPDLALYVLGLLEGDDATAFAEHLRGCARCRREFAELESLEGAVRLAAPPPDVPSGLEERTFAAIARAGGRDRLPAAEPEPRPAPPRPRPPLARRRRWALLGAAGAATAAVAVGVVVASSGTGGGPAPAAQRLALQTVRGRAATVTVDLRTTAVGRQVRLTMRGLPDPRPRSIYELWFVGPGDTRRRPNRVSAGTFHPDERGNGTVALTGAADPKRFPRLSVTLESADGSPRRTGPEVLRATQR